MSVLNDLFASFHASAMKPLAALPGPAPIFPTGNALSLMGPRPWEACGQWGRQYGPVTLIWIFGSPALVLNGADEIGQVLESQSDDFYKASPTQALEPVITRNCPFICNGADWQFKRENHPFAVVGVDAWLETQTAPLTRTLTEGLRAIAARSKANPVDLSAEMLRLSFDTFSVAVWGKTLGDDAYAWFTTLGNEGSFRIKSPFPQLPVLDPSFWWQRAEWYGLYAKLIAAARANPDPARTDLMATLTRMPTKLTPDGFRDSLANVFFGGVFSVASALTTTLYLSNAHPATATRPVDHVLREALRYYCPVPLYSRNTRTTGPVTFAGVNLPPNTTLFITNAFLHRDPKHWKDPDRFDPDRWADGGVERDPVGSGHFFPFGRGPRMCVGYPFAMYYMKLALQTIRERARVSMPQGQPYVQAMHFGVMSPQHLIARFEMV